jgi:hypothetical protein
MQMVTWISALVGIAGLIFAYIQYQQRIRVENILRNSLRRLAGTVRVIAWNAKWADDHLRSIAHSLGDEPLDLRKIRRDAVDGARDATACARLLGIAHSQIQEIQQAQFKDSEEILPNLKGDDVKAALLAAENEMKKPTVAPASTVQK